jgi:hypothetical protein
MEPYEVFKTMSLVVVWGIPAILILGVIVFIVLAPAFAFGGMVSKLYERVFAGQKRVTRTEPVPTIGEMLRAAKLPPEEEPLKGKTVVAKEK